MGFSEQDPCPTCKTALQVTTEAGQSALCSAGDVHPRELPKLITNSVGMKLTLIPAGEFMMGSPDSDKDAYPDEKPQHRVRITRPFYLGVYPVTQAEYERVMGGNPSYFTGDANRPVEQVSWDDAVEFCRKLSEKEGRTYRLPTEAEWEYACRAGSTTRYCSGDDEVSLGEYAWYEDNSGPGVGTHPVGEKRPNAWGLYDMHGNVWQWCADWCGKVYYAGSPTDDPAGPAWGPARMDRGGAWYLDPECCRSAVRGGHVAGIHNSNLGFRVCVAPADK
jgi:formylglycine-generating enzyme required for sulfatase activity